MTFNVSSQYDELESFRCYLAHESFDTLLDHVKEVFSLYFTLQCRSFGM